MEKQVTLSSNLSIEATTTTLDLSRSALYELLKKKSENFPRPFKIGRRTYFSEREVAQWLADRPRIAAPASSSAEIRDQAHLLKG
ncbi:MAG: AlpA family phage regulatory protein [Hydrogenophaga sp.]|jgi:predicted DNA-binding transcriptional regulator AlpA|nr:AlpA family phage regulatory protein [Hydrogenophaga sp.]